ncbi:MAG: helix-turn-helix domain-containing protein [Pikeienuella sp.]
MRKIPNPVDAHVGARLRLRRMSIGMSQERLGRLLGLTFQQIQKYEKGANRIGASRLFAIAHVLDAPVQYFFDDLPADARASLPGTAPECGDGDAPEDIRISGSIVNAEGLELTRSFHRIADPATRRHLAELVRSLARGA